MRAVARSLTGMILMVAVTLPAWAHALAGERLFPATLAFDDPGVVSELPVTASRQQGATTASAALSKTITRRLGFSLSKSYVQGAPGGDWQNGTLALAYQIYRSGAHESIGMLQIADTIGHTGPLSYSTYTPEFAFGQGFGALPHRLRMLRPLA